MEELEFVQKKAKQAETKEEQKKSTYCQSGCGLKGHHNKRDLMCPLNPLNVKNKAQYEASRVETAKEELLDTKSNFVSQPQDMLAGKDYLFAADCADKVGINSSTELYVEDAVESCADKVGINSSTELYVQDAIESDVMSDGHGDECSRCSNLCCSLMTLHDDLEEYK